MIELARWAGPPILAAAAVFWFDRSMERRGLLPPLFRRPAASGGGWTVRRAAAALLLFAVFWLTVFAALGLLGTTADAAFVAPATPQLFLVHAILLVSLVVWYVLGFVGPGAASLVGRASPARQFGLRAPSIAAEMGLGLLCGIAAWVVVLTLLIAVGAVVWALGGDDALPRQAPPIVPWIASLPIALRLAISASAGFAEELFFRGFLQPRVGIAASTVLFAVAHLSYDQPMMLVGITLLSLVFAFIVRWRQNVWAAVTAHAVFDAIQLGFVIPWALRYLEADGGGLVALLVW